VSSLLYRVLYVPTSSWRTQPRKGIIPRSLRELHLGACVLFDIEDQLAPPGKLWERVTYYCSRERARSDKTKKFIRQLVTGEENNVIGVRVYRVK